MKKAIVLVLMVLFLSLPSIVVAQTTRKVSPSPVATISPSPVPTDGPRVDITQK